MSSVIFYHIAAFHLCLLFQSGCSAPVRCNSHPSCSWNRLRLISYFQYDSSNTSQQHQRAVVCGAVSYSESRVSPRSRPESPCGSSCCSSAARTRSRSFIRSAPEFRVPERIHVTELQKIILLEYSILETTYLLLFNSWQILAKQTLSFFFKVSILSLAASDV